MCSGCPGIIRCIYNLICIQADCIMITCIHKPTTHVHTHARTPIMINLLLFASIRQERCTLDTWEVLALELVGVAQEHGKVYIRHLGGACFRTGGCCTGAWKGVH